MKRSMQLKYSGFLLTIGFTLVATTRAQTYLFDDFESVTANWTLSGQDWGLTTASYRSVSNSLTDSPSGNYPNNADARATLAYTLDLSAADFPVLTFWHHYAVDASDRVYVEISTNGGWNWSTLTSFTGYASTWRQEMVDLRLYRTSNVKIRFRLQSDGNNWTSDGWYVDDVGVAEYQPVNGPYPFFDKFEGDTTNWILSGMDWGLTTASYLSVSNSLTDSPSGNYPNNADARATLAYTLDLSAADFPVLTFWHHYAVDASDRVYVEISTNGGWNWSTLTSFTGYASTWRQEMIDLRPYLTTNVTIRFRLQSDGNNWTSDGWYIDDIEMREFVDVRVSVTASDSTAGEPATGQGDGTFTFSRNGPTETALTINYTVSGTAGSGVDYQPLGTTIVFAPGSATATTNVTVINDDLVESDETVILTLANGSGYTVETPSTAPVTIEDDESVKLRIFHAVELEFPGAAQRTYRVEWCSALGTNTWYQLTNSIPGNGNPISVFDSTRYSEGRFYRVVVEE